MSKVTCIAFAAALIVSGSTLALAQNGQPTGGDQPVAGGANAGGAPGPSETATPQTTRAPRHRHGTLMMHYKIRHHKHTPQQ